MTSCWKFGPEERPEFSKLVNRIDDFEGSISHSANTTYLTLFS